MFDGTKGGLIMKFLKLLWVVTVLLLAAALTSCNIGSTPAPAQDANAIYTSVAGTMIAQFNDQQTQTAQAIPPSPLAGPTIADTFTPLPIFTEIPLGMPISINTPVSVILPTPSTGGLTWGETGIGCDDATYLSETEPARGTMFRVGDHFAKSWSFQNTGTCIWINSYTFAFISGSRMGGKDIPISRTVDFTVPGKSHTFTINFVAPHGAGHYTGAWQMKNATGTQFGARVWVDIVVK